MNIADECVELTETIIGIFFVLYGREERIMNAYVKR